MHVIDQYKKNYIEIDHKERMQEKNHIAKRNIWKKE